MPARRSLASRRHSWRRRTRTCRGSSRRGSRKPISLVPVASEYRSLLLLFAIVGVIVLALTLWFTVKFSAPMVETDMALVAHPPLHRVAEEETV